MRKRTLPFCCAQALLLCYVQISEKRILLLFCLGLFLLQTAYACIRGYALPVLLFYLPWAPLLRFSPDSISFYTLALLLACCIQTGKNKLSLKSDYVAIALAIAVLSLLAKIIGGYRLTNSYWMFLAMLALFPMLDFENRAYSFFWLTVFFSLGIILAALTAERFSDYPNIAKYITVDVYLSITRRSGYYGDPNFYAAHITAAIAGCFALISNGQTRRRTLALLIATGFLVYCGFLSGSKSFFLTGSLLLLLWVIEICLGKKKIAQKTALLLILLAFLFYIASSALFHDKLDVMLARLSKANTASEFTTGRTDLWKRYLAGIFNSPRLLLLGQGFTNILIAPKASHNTLIQLLYQLGIFGGLLLAAWHWRLCREIVGDPRPSGTKAVCIAMLAFGALLPWMAVDILFFDELFLIPTYVLIGMDELCSDNKLCEEGLDK